MVRYISSSKYKAVVVSVVTKVNSDKVLCGSSGLYPSYVAAILESVKEIQFYTQCSKRINYADYLEKSIAEKESVLQHAYRMLFSFIFWW